MRKLRADHIAGLIGSDNGIRSRRVASNKTAAAANGADSIAASSRETKNNLRMRIFD